MAERIGVYTIVLPGSASRNHGSKDRWLSVARYTGLVVGAALAVVALVGVVSDETSDGKAGYARTEALKQLLDTPTFTKLNMEGDIATLKDIHGAYVRGSVPTAAQESDDIMNQPFSDERNGADSAAVVPNAYITGTVSTADAEARDITAFASSTLSRTNEKKDVSRTEKLLQLPFKARLTKLNMQGDVATLKDIHAAYVRGSVPTAAQESDDILNQTFIDEPHGPDSRSVVPNSYVTGTVNTADAEARDITAFAASTLSRTNEKKDVSRTEKLLQLPFKARLTKLNMQGDVATLKDIHAAYVRGSVPTAAQESDDILNQTFTDEPHGPDSRTVVPNSYVTGTVNTADAEARDITAFAASTLSRTNN